MKGPFCKSDIARCKLTLAMVLPALLIFAATALSQTEEDLIHKHWFEMRTAHFKIYSSGPAQEVGKLGARLEQFHDAYALLAPGAQSLVSPPITVMAFQDLDAMQPFLPLYNGKPANLAGFFKPSQDENLIVLSLSENNSRGLETIFHEFAHFLFRLNDNVWPIWLQEGMAEIYSTFECSGRSVIIAQPIEHHLRLLARHDLMPLHELLSVTHDSPQYNEADRQGVFYAESWLLAHFLMNGDNPAFKSRFGRYTTFLRQGQSPEKALVSALGVPLPTIESEFHRYLERGQFESVLRVVAADLSAPRATTTRPIGQSETCFRLGNELMRIDRLDAAEPYFEESAKLYPGSPLAYEGLGLLAAERNKPDDAVKNLKDSLARGSTSFLVHYVYAQERFRQTADAQERYGRVNKELAAEIRAELSRSIQLMPSFGKAHELLGFFELVQGENYPEAAQHLQRALQLEPEHQSYRIYLAQAQMMMNDLPAARQTLEPLMESFVDSKLRKRAQEVLAEMDRHDSRK